MIRVFGILLLFAANSVSAQTPSKKYIEHTKLADSLFLQKDYRLAANNYVSAFTSNGDIAMVSHRYKLASCYAQLNVADSAFIQLDRIVTKGKYADYDAVSKDKSFSNLYSDKRWNEFLDKVYKMRKSMVIPDEH
jgi:hypothetical protein